MKRITLILLALAVAFAMLGCTAGAEVGAPQLTGDEEITMATIDQYLDADARFVDLRDFADFFNGGYVAGFEAVPFFQYLEGRALVRNNGWEFSASDVANAALLENVFGPTDTPIVLMCGSGARAGYVKEALESIGYTTVFNAGGIRDYAGDNKILGDGMYTGARALPAEVTMANIDQYLSRPGAKYLDLRNIEDLYVGGYIDGFELVSFFQYIEGNAVVRNNGWEFSEADIVNEAILRNIFGPTDREVFLMCGSGARAGYMKDVLEAIGYTTVMNVGGIRDYAGDHKILGDPNAGIAVSVN